MNHVIGFLGTNLDRAGSAPTRWEVWRPSVGLCQQEDLIVDCFELIHEPRYRTLALQVCEDIALISPETEVRLVPLSIRDPWDFQEVYEALYDLFQGMAFDPEAVDYFAHMTTGTHVIQICLFLLTETHHFPGKLLQTGPRQGRRKTDPAGTMQIIDLDLSKYDRLATRFASEQEEARDMLRSGIPTRNAAFNRLIDEIEVVALRSQAPMLLSGPTGAGKTHLARRIYELRAQRCSLDGPFVEVNCATLRGDTAMSTLFGHRKGAFTGAQSDRKGLLREADGGLLFLDEIGELGLDEQAMLLRALEDRTFLPVGSDQPVSSSFQLIAGSNRDLGESVCEGRFREDLLSRIHLWSFRLPALAERREDIAPNIDYELRRFEREQGRAVQFNREALEAFVRFAEAPGSLWRGNFRDLNAAITRMATLADRGRISESDVNNEQARLEQQWGAATGGGEPADQLEDILSTDVLSALDPFDRVQLAYTVKVCRASRNMSEAGRSLFAASRLKKAVANDSDRLRKYLGKFGLGFDDLRMNP